MADYLKNVDPSKRIATKIITAYGQGVTSMTEGVEYTAYGRDLEVSKFEQMLKLTKQSSGVMQGFVGPYGVGKSFVLALFKHIAHKKNFVVMNADITRSRWFAGSKTEKQGLNLYRELIKNTSIKGENKNAFDIILRSWYEDLKEETDGSLASICSEFNRRTRSCNNLTMYEDIRKMICVYFEEIYDNRDCQQSMNFFMANISNKNEAKEIGANDYIHESQWFDVMNTWSHLFVVAGYSGLILMIDQADYLLNLPKIGRQQNYEYLLSMWNQVNQGMTEYMSVCMFAADSLVNNEKKGTSTYIALDDRMRGCVELEMLPANYLVALMVRLKRIHEIAYGWQCCLTDDDAEAFVNDALGMDGTVFNGNCIRPISVGWIQKLNDLQIMEEKGENIATSDNSKYLDIVKSEVDRPEPEEEPLSDLFPDN